MALLCCAVWTVRTGEGLLSSMSPDVTIQVVIVTGTVATKSTYEHVPASGRGLASDG